LLTLAIGVLLWKSSKETILVSSMMQSYGIVCYKAMGQTKWIRKLVPGVNNGRQQQ
jgi:hypothetical protein